LVLSAWTSGAVTNHHGRTGNFDICVSMTRRGKAGPCQRLVVLGSTAEVVWAHPGSMSDHRPRSRQRRKPGTASNSRRTLARIGWLLAVRGTPEEGIARIGFGRVFRNHNPCCPSRASRRTFFFCPTSIVCNTTCNRYGAASHSRSGPGGRACGSWRNCGGPDSSPTPSVTKTLERVEKVQG
jgi:hypothetical protein